MLENYSDILEVKDLCEILHISLKSAYALLHSGQIQYLKIGRHYRIPKCALKEFIKSDL